MVVSLGADFLGAGPAASGTSRDFANGRRVRKAKAEMNRLYVAETALSPTGSIADHRLPARASQIEAIARALHAAISGGGGASVGSAEMDKWITAAAKDLQANRAAGLVVAGDQQPPAVHALAHAMNAALGNAGATVVYTDPVSPSPSTRCSPCVSWSAT